MMNARRLSSLKLYDTYALKWRHFCDSHNWNYVFATVGQGLIFLQQLLNNGSGYSVLNTARSALSAIIILPSGPAFGSHPDVCLFMKGVFNLKPTKPKYVSTWDPTVVLSFLEGWSPADYIDLEKLTLKIIVLILLITGQRPQIIPKLNIRNLKSGSDFYEFVLEVTDFKQGRPNYRPSTILLKAFKPNKKLCIFRYLTVYIQKTALLRKEQSQLILTHKKPYKAASANSISRWIKQVLTLSGVDIGVFSAGSTRAASTSKAKEQGASVDQILHMGGWSRETTFNTYYNRPVLPTPVAERLLNCIDHNTD
jgi:integrase